MAIGILSTLLFVSAVFNLVQWLEHKKLTDKYNEQIRRNCSIQNELRVKRAVLTRIQNTSWN